jgi:hypothetical protein
MEKYRAMEVEKKNNNLKACGRVDWTFLKFETICNVDINFLEIENTYIMNSIYKKGYHLSSTEVAGFKTPLLSITHWVEYPVFYFWVEYSIRNMGHKVSKSMKYLNLMKTLLYTKKRTLSA